MWQPPSTNLTFPLARYNLLQPSTCHFSSQFLTFSNLVQSPAICGLLNLVQYILNIRPGDFHPQYCQQRNDQQNEKEEEAVAKQQPYCVDSVAKELVRRL